MLLLQGDLDTVSMLGPTSLPPPWVDQVVMRVVDKTYAVLSNHRGWKCLYTNSQSQTGTCILMEHTMVVSKGTDDDHLINATCGLFILLGVEQTHPWAFFLLHSGIATGINSVEEVARAAGISLGLRSWSHLERSPVSA